MVELEAGTPPHIVTRRCHDQEDAEWWARELIGHGFAAVTLDGVPFGPATAEASDPQGPTPALGDDVT